MVRLEVSAIFQTYHNIDSIALKLIQKLVGHTFMDSDADIRVYAVKLVPDTRKEYTAALIADAKRQHRGGVLRDVGKSASQGAFGLLKLTGAGHHGFALGGQFQGRLSLK